MAGGEPPATLSYIGIVIDRLAGTSEKRLRPIVLTAAAAFFGMIPIAFEVFWARWPTRLSAASLSQLC